MSNHISEELPRLLTGDASRDVVMAAAEHLRICPDCQQELVSAVVAHASLTSAHRFAPEIVMPDSSSIADIGSQRARHAAETADSGDEATELPNMTSMFAQIREEAEAKPAKTHQRRRLLAVAAAAVVLVGGGTAVYTAEHGSSSPTTRVALAAFQQGTAAPYDDQSASAVIDGDTVSVDASKLPQLGAAHQYEVWLTNEQRDSMLPLGYIGNQNKAKLTVPPKVKLSSYTNIEVSVQRVGQYKYSQVSVLRGSYG